MKKLTFSLGLLSCLSTTFAYADSVNLALNKAVTVSSEFSVDVRKEFAVDGRITTDNTGRFSSLGAAINFLEVDLGNVFNLQQIDLHHGKYTSYPMIDFEILYKKTAAEPYTRLQIITGNASIMTSHPALVGARYVKVVSTKSASGMMRIKEILVIGDSTPVGTTPVNQAPVVSAGADTAITLPLNSVALVASANDPNSDPMTYSWSQILGSTATISAPNSLATTFSGLLQGNYTFRFTANDGKGGVTSDDVAVVVNAAAPVNAAPVVNAGADQVLVLPTNSVSLSGSATDLNGDALIYSWSKVSGSTANFTTSASATTSVSGLVQGSYVFKLTVSDGKGGVSSDDVAVVLNPLPAAGLDPNAGKVSLWIRQGTVHPTNWDYDAAVFLPADYGSDPNKKYPMILSLHGLGGTVMDTNHTAVGGNKEGFIKQVWSTPLSATYPAIVIAPSARQKGSSTNKWWNWSFNKRLIESALVKYKIDPKRVVVTGLSAGGLGTSDLAKNTPSLLAGAMQGAFNEDIFTTNPCDLNVIPFWSFGNRSDGTFQPEAWENVVQTAITCSNWTGSFKLNVYESTCGHGCWDQHWAKPEVQQWLRSQVKP